jgi:hypothetical protein
VTINSRAPNFRKPSSPNDKPHFTQLNFIDSEGTITEIGNSAEFYGNPIDDIKFLENADSSLTILISKLFDYDIPFPYHRFDISADSVTSYFNYDPPDGSWADSDSPIAIFGDDRYLKAQGEYVFVLDDEFGIIDTLDIPNQDYKLCQFGKHPILYNQNNLVRTDTDSLIILSNLDITIESLTYVDDFLLFVTPTELILTDSQFISDTGWALPINSKVLNITGSGSDYFLTIRNTESGLMSLWQATVGAELTEISANIAEPGAIMGMNNDSMYHYTTTVEMSDNHQQTLVNRTLRDGAFESDYDFLPEIDLSVSDIILDSIVFDSQLPQGFDTLDIYHHYYNGELTLTNNTLDTIHNINIYSQWLLLWYDQYEVNNSYNWDFPITPGQTLTFPIRYESDTAFDNEQISFYCYGYNDRRLETPIEIISNIIASNEEYVPIEFSVYPNPVQDHLTIQVVEEAKIDYAVLYDASGKFVEYFDGNSKVYDVSKIATGIYFFKLVSIDGRHGTQVIYKE